MLTTSNAAALPGGPATGSRRWAIGRTPAPGWAHLLRECNGGFFHAPPVLDACLPSGAPVYARLQEGTRTVALAVGVGMRCRLASRPVHFRFAALPAVAAGIDPGAAAATLAAQLAGAGAAEVHMGSFGAAAPVAVEGAAPGRRRTEYAIPLSEPDRMLAAMITLRRRDARRGESGGWTLAQLRGSSARTLLREVVANASERATQRGDGFPLGHLLDDTLLGARLEEPWGMTLWAAFEGDAPLAAALVGWGGRRAYYVSGGSTLTGYKRRSATWLHFRIACTLAAHGFVEYNLGGTSAAAAEPGNPANGLHQFKLGFGVQLREGSSLSWTPRPRHMRVHRWLAPLRGGDA